MKRMNAKFLFAVSCLVGSLICPVIGQDRPATEASLPSPAGVWSAKDYLTTARVLASGKMPPPRLSSDEGKAFFQRLTAKENLERLRDEAVPVATRTAEGTTIVGSVGSILKEYLILASEDKSAYKEVAQIMAFTLRSSAAFIDVATKLPPATEPDELSGMKEMKSGFIRIVGGAEKVLFDTFSYSAEDLSIILQAMAEVVPTVKREFPPDRLAALHKDLKGHQRDFKGKDAELLQKMIDELESAKVPEKAP